MYLCIYISLKVYTYVAMYNSHVYVYVRKCSFWITNFFIGNNKILIYLISMHLADCTAVDVCSYSYLLQHIPLLVVVDVYYQMHHKLYFGGHSILLPIGCKLMRNWLFWLFNLIIVMSYMRLIWFHQRMTSMIKLKTDENLTVLYNYMHNACSSELAT